jgi:hypothetical protein
MNAIATDRAYVSAYIAGFGYLPEHWSYPRAMPAGRLDGLQPGRKGWKIAAAAAAGREDGRNDARVQRAKQMEELNELRLKQIAQERADKAANDAAGRAVLRNMYGRSYFGSGCAFGRVRLLGARLEGEKDNGFIRGPAAVVVLDPSKPAAFLAKGSDAIGEGRSWSEAGVWSPMLQEWLLCTEERLWQLLPIGAQLG